MRSDIIATPVQEADELAVRIARPRRRAEKRQLLAQHRTRTSQQLRSAAIPGHIESLE
ncbi:hypothetical protein HPB47_011018, partial [Ixodes persulcatus]